MTIVLVMICMAGCVSLPQRASVPQALADKALLEGMDRPVRIWGDESPPGIEEEIAIRNRQALSRFGGTDPKEVSKQTPELSFLAISGGGADGAFGAGLLNGWTAHGSRPEFEIVTGVSTGALIAPFAFLGSDYDDELKEAYTKLSSKNIIETGVFNILEAIFGGIAIGDTTPFARTIRQYATREMFDKIAEEHNKGRRLFIGTTNLDAERSVIWDIGRLANSGAPDALFMFHKILRASAAIPGAMPPVIFDVTANGRNYQELHVDGGVTSQVFIYPVELELNKYIPKEDRENRRLFVIRNSKITPEYNPVKTSLFDISAESIGALIKNQGIGDLYKLSKIAERDGFLFHFATVPSEFNAKSHEAFDPDYMSALYDLGYKMAIEGYPWRNDPTKIPYNKFER
ncbi:MAG: patatin-like phospholipase family protein [Pseudomonadota bacterium]